MTPPNTSGFPESRDPFQNDSDLDIKRYLSLFVSNWYWFAFSLFIAFTIAYGTNRYSEKIYTVTSTMLIKDQQIGGGLNNNAQNFFPGAEMFNSQQNLKNEMGILKSYSLNKRVIDSLQNFRIEYFGIGRRNIVQSRLYTQCPFIVMADSCNYMPLNTEVIVKILSAKKCFLEINGDNTKTDTLQFGCRYKKYGFDFVIKLRDPGMFVFNPDISNKYFFYFTESGSLANDYRNSLNVNPIDKDATLVTLSVSGPVKEQEADYLNKLMDIYISQGLEAKNVTEDSTLVFIERQIDTISCSLRKAEDSLQQFQLRNKMVDISKEGSAIQTKLEGFEEEKRAIELKQVYYKYLKDYINSKNESGDIISPSIMGIENPELGKLVEDLAELQKDKLKLAMNLSENQPPLAMFDENISTTKKYLAENIRSSLENLGTALSSVNLSIDSVNLYINKLPATERELITIQRDYEVNNTVYTFLLEKKAETGIARASNISDNKIIDRADIANAVQIMPRTSRNNLKALLFGILVPGILISLLYYFNNKIIDNDDILKRTRAPVIGYISHSESIKEIAVVDKPGSSLAESFRAVRTSLRYLVKDNQHPVISITSTITSEGKTFISVNLAAIIAMLGKKVLLIGLDLRKPRIHRILDIDNSNGLSIYLSNNSEYEDVIKKTQVENLFYATSGPVPPNPAELINSERMKVFIEKAKQEYDYIIIDTPPIAVVADTMLLSDFTDINLFIVRQRFSSKNTIELIEELYQGGKLKNMGIIVNDISLTGYYGYGLMYGYYKGYGYSYGRNYYGEYSYSRYGYNDKQKNYYEL